MYSFTKSMIISFLFPMPLCLELLSIGLIFLWVSKKEHLGKIIISIGFLLLLLFSSPIFSNLLLDHLEQHYPKLTLKDNDLTDVKYIVVLASGHVLDPRLPITSQFTSAGLVRLTEGVRLHKWCQEAKLILSGGIGKDPVPDAELMADLSIALGVPKGDIILEAESMSTFDGAMFVRPIVKEEGFLLVTSASHMPRAMALFRKLGMNPVPAPTGHLVKHYGNKLSVMPSTSSLMKSDTMIRELLGLIKEKFMGRI